MVCSAPDQTYRIKYDRIVLLFDVKNFVAISFFLGRRSFQLMMTTIEVELMSCDTCVEKEEKEQNWKTQDEIFACILDALTKTSTHALEKGLNLSMFYCRLTYKK